MPQKQSAKRSKSLLLILIVIAVMLVGIVGFAGFSDDAETKRLSELSTEELFGFFADQGVAFPANAIPGDINALVREIENDPQYNPFMSWTEAQEVIASVRNAVNVYYGITIEE